MPYPKDSRRSLPTEGCRDTRFQQHRRTKSRLRESHWIATTEEGRDVPRGQPVSQSDHLTGSQRTLLTKDNQDALAWQRLHRTPQGHPLTLNHFSSQSARFRVSRTAIGPRPLQRKEMLSPRSTCTYRLFHGQPPDRAHLRGSRCIIEEAQPCQKTHHER